MFPRAGLQLLLNANVLNGSVLIDGVSEDDVEGPGGRVEVVIQDLYTHHEGATVQRTDVEGCGIVSVLVGGCGRDNDFVKGIDDLIGKSCDEDAHESNGQDATDESSVFWLSADPKEGVRVEEICFVDDGFEGTRKDMERFYFYIVDGY